jgi:hypothetical protein
MNGYVETSLRECVRHVPAEALFAGSCHQRNLLWGH